MRQLPRTAVPAMRRLVILVVIGSIVAVVTAFFTPGDLAVLIGWDVAALTYVAFVWVTVGGCDAELTEALATIEDNTRIITHLFLISASVASLAGTGFELYRASETSGAEKFFLSSIGVVTVIASWSVVHSVFALRYAHEYYTPPVGGIDFKTAGERPD